MEIAADAMCNKNFTGEFRDSIHLLYSSSRLNTVQRLDYSSYDPKLCICRLIPCVLCLLYQIFVYLLTLKCTGMEVFILTVYTVQH